mmetsp:Transcript_20252/g.29827  ORF Transcript_20252/g.29827 Transcript_20252/m.29827 type:complete len:317 (-) Transcript_20252:313-1263(-)
MKPRPTNRMPLWRPSLVAQAFLLAVAMVDVVVPDQVVPLLWIPPVEAFGVGRTIRQQSTRRYATPKSSTANESSPGRIRVAPIVVPKAPPPVSLLEKEEPPPPILTEDLVALADLRYNEWMAEESSSESVPSRYAFRMATAEIASERAVGSATTFLAKLDTLAVAAAELSSIEFEDVVLSNEQQTFLYVTDVVTSSQHRRRGIANHLMDFLEDYACCNGKVTLWLHVKPENTQALAFYKNRGYTKPSFTEGMDLMRLEDNAGIANEHQMLLSKTLSHKPQARTMEMEEPPPKNTAGATGFGAAPKANRKKKSKRKK